MYQVLSIKGLFVKNLQILIFLIIIISLDQLSKFIVYKYYPFIIVLNQNGTLGIGPWWVGLVALLILGYYLIRYKQTQLIYWLIFGAGISNIIDRIIYNSVIDWIHTFPWFPVFNLADVFITGGVILILGKEIFINNHSK